MVDRVCRRMLIVGVAGLAAALVIVAVRFPQVAMLGGLIAVVVLRRRAARGHNVYGTAQWCTADDARRAGLL
ncbi:MAG: hypothetical protein U0871_15015 [Gemmataceae bacterium]